MLKLTCKTCKYWEPFSGACTNGLSENRGSFMNGEDECEWHRKNIHKGCGGILEGRVSKEQTFKTEHYCYRCLFTVLIDGKPIEETREWLK